MKKFIVSILAVLYLVTSTGATIHMHYCMGKLADWNLGHQESKTCSKCGMDKDESKNNGCCKDEHRFLKDDSAQKITESNIQFTDIVILGTPPAFFQLTDFGFVSITDKKPNCNAPPRKQDCPIYILNCVFLI